MVVLSWAVLDGRVGFGGSLADVGERGDDCIRSNILLVRKDMVDIMGSLSCLRCRNEDSH